MFYILVVFLYFITSLNGKHILLNENDDFETNFINEVSKTDEIRKPNNFMIFPGTKWCGPGDIASNDDDLGVFKETDQCCREHDFCDDIIDGYQTKYNLTNPDFHTRLNCRCDNLFYECLKADGKHLSSKYVGYLYFNLIDTKCFQKDYPIKRCAHYNTQLPLLRRCDQYEFDRSKDEIYQWFDLPLFL